MKHYALIMAGGSGTRLWPRSRVDQPKQFLDLVGNATMLQQSFTRLSPLLEPAQIFIVTNAAYTARVAEQLPELPPENILGESEPRGTAAAIGLGALAIRERDPEGIMMVLTADHLIADTTLFRRALAAAAALAAEDWLVTLGIQPDAPETGYGYIERADALPQVNGLDAYRVARFVEKPSFARAQEFLASGAYTWNSGMFIWKVARILDEIQTQMPALGNALNEITALRASGAQDKILPVWRDIQTETIDYGVMEHAQRVAVLPVNIGWNDVGSWAAVYDVLPKDKTGNAVVGTHVTLDSQRNLIYAPKRAVATFGLSDFVVVDTDDVLLICPRERTQEVKQLAGKYAEHLKQIQTAPTAPQTTEPLTISQMRALFENIPAEHAVLLSFILHAGLAPQDLVALQEKDVDSRGWIHTKSGWRPLPDRTLAELLTWQRASNETIARTVPQWESVNAIMQIIAELRPSVKPEQTVEQAHETLANALFTATEEGKWIRSVLGADAASARMPLETLFPFSIPDFQVRDDDFARSARAALNHAVATL